MTAAQDAHFIAMTGRFPAVARTPLPIAGLELLVGRDLEGSVAELAITYPTGELVADDDQADILDAAHRHALHLAQRTREATAARSALNGHHSVPPSNSANGALLSPTPHAIETASGLYVDVSAPDPCTVTLQDIGHGLALTCRYGGQLDRFYSVAEHAVLVHDLLVHQGASEELRLAGLFHDAAEAYLGDVVAPLKYALRRGAGTSVYDEFSAKMDKAICDRYDVSLEQLDSGPVRAADTWALRIEARSLTRSGGRHWRWNGSLPNGGELPSDVIWPAGLDWASARDLWHETVSLYRCEAA